MRLILAAIIASVASGCAHAWVKSEPPGARLSVGGKLVGTGRATVSTPKGMIVVVRADHEGFRPACAVIEYRRDTTITLTRAVPNDPPLPSDSEIERAWIADRTNLCDARAAQNRPPDVIISAGDLSRPYDVLGEVRVDTTERSGGIAVSAVGVLRGGIFVAFRPELKGAPSEMLNALRDAAIAHFGPRVDAVVNANVFHEDSDLFARGVAVHFIATPPTAAPARSVQERLDELDRLGAAGVITPTEYKERRKAILGDL